MAEETVPGKQGSLSYWILPVLLLGLLLGLSHDSFAGRQWDSKEISDVKNNVEDIVDRLKADGDISTVAADLRDQLEVMNYEGLTPNTI